VGISGTFFPDLLSCKGDEGAKALLKANEGSLVKVPVGDPGVLRDIDRPEDLAPPSDV
jgi:molybdenum cofactor cytidylyltransferase